MHALCGAVILVFTFALFTFGWIGGGDAKLAAATALWLGWTPLADYGLVSALAGGALTSRSSSRAELRFPLPRLAHLDRPAAQRQDPASPTALP